MRSQSTSSLQRTSSLQSTSSLKQKFDSFDQYALHLHTPAHQGVGPQTNVISKDLLYLDSPYITRCDLKPLEEKTAVYYNTEYSFVLTGGATQGLIAALLTLGRKHQRVWVQRNCHKSVVSGLILSGLEPVFFAPTERVLSAQDLAKFFAEFEGNAPTCIVLTNPTYEGWGCDLETCIAVCRAQGLTIVVDEAHGGLWPTSSALPASAVEAGADLVVHSLHKYCGAIVQSALVHLPQGSSISYDEYHSALEMVETTSKSNLVLLSIEETLETIFAPSFCDRLAARIERLDRIRNWIEASGNVLQIIEPSNTVKDPLKFFVASKFANSEQLVRYFAEVGVDYELYDDEGVLFIFSIYHTDFDLDLFENALEVVMKRVAQAAPENQGSFLSKQNQPHMQLIPRAAHFHPLGYEAMPISQAVGRIAAEMVASCPPGWPLVIPGELLGNWHVQTLGENFKVKVLKQSRD